jgi:hypothetical protein
MMLIRKLFLFTVLSMAVWLTGSHQIVGSAAAKTNPQTADKCTLIVGNSQHKIIVPAVRPGLVYDRAFFETCLLAVDSPSRFSPLPRSCA